MKNPDATKSPTARSSTARSTFGGYSKAALTFLRQIVDHNERDWFKERKEIYETEVRGATAELVAALNAKLVRFAPEYVTEPKKAIPRIYRDLRFTDDKRPYKVNVAAVFPRRGGVRNQCASFYVSISAQGVLVIAGAQRPDASYLGAVRQRIAAEPKVFERLLRRKALRECYGDGERAVLGGPRLVNVPRGFPRDHPAADVLRCRRLCLTARLPLKSAATGELLPALTHLLRAATPFVTWLDECSVGAASPDSNGETDAE